MPGTRSKECNTGEIVVVTCLCASIQYRKKAKYWLSLCRQLWVVTDHN